MQRQALPIHRDHYRGRRLHEGDVHSYLAEAAEQMAPHATGEGVEGARGDCEALVVDVCEPTTDDGLSL